MLKTFIGRYFFRGTDRDTVRIFYLPPFVPNWITAVALSLGERINTGKSKSICASDDYSTKTRKHVLNSFNHLPGYIRNVDRAILHTVFENTVRRVSKCLETLLTLLVTFCIVIRCTKPF
jgi:hypothetical protein